MATKDKNMKLTHNCGCQHGAAEPDSVKVTSSPAPEKDAMASEANKLAEAIAAKANELQGCVLLVKDFLPIIAAHLAPLMLAKRVADTLLARRDADARNFEAASRGIANRQPWIEDAQNAARANDSAVAAYRAALAAAAPTAGGSKHNG